MHEGKLTIPLAQYSFFNKIQYYKFKGKVWGKKKEKPCKVTLLPLLCCHRYWFSGF